MIVQTDNQKSCQFQQLPQLQFKMSGISYSTFERDFRTIKRLGKGNYATVTQVQHLLDQRTYAHKCIELPSLQDLSQAFNEIETCKSIDDQCIVKLHYFYTRENKKTGKYELGMIMDLCYSTLSENIKARKRRNDYFSKSQLKDFLATMIPFFAKMQRKGYLHRDIKPDNILLMRNGFNKTEFKVGDFGFSIRLNAYSTQNIAGTMEYVSPKLLVKFKDNKVIVPGHNFKDDVYSFGKTLYEFMLLEINTPVEKQKLLQCASRYGNEYCGLVSMMLKEAEIERPDFIYLESYATRKELINQSVSEISKNNFLSISTVNGASSKDKLGLSQVEKRSSKSKEKAADYTKTRRKEYDNYNDLTKIEENTVPGKANNLKRLTVKEEVIKKKVINYKEEIHSLAVCDSFLFVGSQGKFGIMLLANEKLIKLKCQGTKRAVTCIRIDPMKRYIFFGTLDSKLYTIEFTEVKKLIIDNNQALKDKSEIELPLAKVKHRTIELSLPVSTFDCFYLDDGKDSSFAIGHYTGQTTYLTADSKITQASFSRSPITQIAFHAGCIYSSNTEGVFRREVNLGVSLNSLKEEGSKNYRLVVHEKNSVYKYHEMIIGFQIVEKCKLNQGITKDASKYLAILISYDGMAHFISRSFRLQKLIRLTHSPVLAANFDINTYAEMGANGLIIDTDGMIYGEEGGLVGESQEKQICCITGGVNQMYLGGFNGNITIFSRKEALRID